jgi:hypothetical protein
MMRTGILIVAALGLAGCERAAERAEKEFSFLSDNGGSKSEKCRAAIKARDAWAERQVPEKYDDWQFYAKVYC